MLSQMGIGRWRGALGLAQRRFNMAVNPGIRLPENWKRAGSVQIVDFAGRSNVVCLQTKKRAARIRHTISLQNQADHAFSVEVFSPVGNKTWGAGVVNGAWHPSGGMWKTLEVPVRDGDDVVISSTGKDDEKEAGDLCYVDLSSIKVTPC